MAFNPFHAFRRHQKVMFALLTILAMVTFVFCAGGGQEPLLNMVMGWFGAGPRGQGAVVTTLYGTKITEARIATAREQRLIARTAVGTALDMASGKLRQEEQSLMLKPDTPDRVTRLADLQTKRQKIDAAQLEFLLTPGGDRVEDILDHLIWLHEADRLGINFVERDVEAQLRSLTQGTLGVTEILEGLALQDRYNRGRYRRESIVPAVADLLRTELARTIVLEPSPTTRMAANEQSMLLRQLQLGQIPPQFLPFLLPETGPLPVTPYEFRGYMAEQRTERDIGLFRVPVPVESKAPLDEKDTKSLRALFDRYKEVEPTPDSSRPGFKEPQRIAIEWISARPADDYWIEQAGKVLPLLPPSLNVLAGASIATTPIGPVGRLNVIALLATADSRLQQAYEAVKTDYPYGRASWHIQDWHLPIYTAKTNVDMAAGLVGDLGGAIGTGGTPLSAVLEFQARALRKSAVGNNVADLHSVVEREAPNRAPFAATAVLSGVNASPLAAVTTPFRAAAVWFHEDRRTQHLPLDTIRPAVEKKMRTEIAKTLVLSKLREFRKELEAKAKQKDVRAWLDKTLAEKWVSLHAAMKEPKDRYNLGTATALEELKKAFERENPFDPKSERFADTFFQAKGGTFEPHALPDDQPFFQGSTESRWSSSEQPFVWWKTADQAAFVPSFEQARPRVEEAWRWMQARPQARKDAEALLAKVKEAAGDRQRLTQIGAERKEPMRQLDRVARLVTMPAPMGPSRPEPFKFPDDLKANPTEWLDKITSLKKKGDAVLLKDLPEQNYYVAVLLSDPKPPTADEVARAYRGGPSGGPMSSGVDPLFREFMRERQAKYRDAILKELRLTAVGGSKGLEEDGRYKLDEAYRKEGRDEGPPVEGG